MSFSSQLLELVLTTWQEQPRDKNTQITQINIMQKVALVNSTTDTFKKPRLRDRTDTAWFSRLVTTSGQEMEWVYSFNPEPARGRK